MRIFVDADELLTWPADEGNEAKIGPAPNLPLIEALGSLNGLYEIVVWSPYGRTYARTWAEESLNAHSVHYQDAIKFDRALLLECRFYVGPLHEDADEGNGMSADSFIRWAAAERAAWDASHATADHGGGH